MIRRDVEWLTASRESSVSFAPLHALDGNITPNGLLFERHHSGIAEVDPAAYALYLNDVIADRNFELNQNFCSLKLNYASNFDDDDRETAAKAFWKKDPCMSNCLPGSAMIVGRASVIDVTPEPGKGPKVA
jgi:hypothetical protein